MSYRPYITAPLNLTISEPRSSLLLWLNGRRGGLKLHRDLSIWLTVNLFFDIKTNLVRHGHGWSRKKKNPPNWIYSVGRRKSIWHKGFTLAFSPPSFMWHWRAMNSDADIMSQSIHIKSLIYSNHMYLLPNSYGYQLLHTHLICCR